MSLIVRMSQRERWAGVPRLQRPPPGSYWPSSTPLLLCLRTSGKRHSIGRRAARSLPQPLSKRYVDSSPRTSVEHYSISAHVFDHVHCHLDRMRRTGPLRTPRKASTGSCRRRAIGLPRRVWFGSVMLRLPPGYFLGTCCDECQAANLRR
jgi:hypothetical protein